MALINGKQISGSVASASYAVTASHSISSSYSDFASTAASASFYLESDPIFTSVSASYATTSSFNQFTSSYIQDSSSFDTRISSNSSSISSLSSSFNNLSGSFRTGSYTGSFTGSLFGTASYAESSTSASYSETSSFSVTASYSQTASVAPDYLPLTGGSITGNVSVSGTGSINIISASAIYSSGSNQFGNSISDVQSLFGNVIVSGSLTVTGSTEVEQINVKNSLTASGLQYPIADNGEESFIQTDGAGTLSLQYVKTVYEEIYNGEAVQLPKGTPVYVSGSQGAAAAVFIARADTPSKMPVVYIVSDNLAPGDTGRGIALGLIKGVNTTGYTAGTEIYVGATGGWTDIRPTGSAIIQILGYVTKEGNGGQGVVLNPGPSNLPNLTSGSIWVGNSNSVPTVVTTSSLSVLSSSYAATASYLLNYINPFPFTGSAEITGSLTVTGSVNVTGSVTIIGTLTASSSYAIQSLSSSFANTASLATISISSSFATSSSISVSSSFSINSTSASYSIYAVTASYIDGGFY